MQEIRQRPLVIYTTNVEQTGPNIPAYIHPQDIVPLAEVIASVKGDEVDFLLETPGGLAETTVDIVNLLRPRFKSVGFIVPHSAMSAGTILVMSGDEILMDQRSSLGAIDPQFMGPDGRPQPAQAILAGIESIKKLVDENNGNLHPVYIPILRNVDPGRLQSAHNASELSKKLVSDWLAEYKFRDWKEHSDGSPVTPAERKTRALEIASTLCDHQNWLSHARPIKIKELGDMRLKITDYAEQPALQEAVWTLWVHLHFAMTSSNLYKIYESESLEFYKVATLQSQAPPLQEMAKLAQKASGSNAVVGFVCMKCGAQYKLQINFQANVPLQPGAFPFPKNGMLTCSSCKTVHNLNGLKMQIEASIGKRAIL